METIFPSLPKLESLRLQNVSTPTIRHGRRIGTVRCGDLCQLPFEQFPALNNRTLFGDNRTKTTSDWPPVKIDFRLFPADLFNFALNLNLAFKPGPMKIQCRSRIFRQVARFSTLIVSEKGEARLAEAFQKNHPSGGHSLFRGGSQRHGVGFAVPGRANRLVKP